ncbi:hypothetical protein M9H77_08415 [Catharanthus roseus]|uniref:Uncharacterized protein n=1 Tax=Catharanthus roseus TaxID=4058 RepID=A0ACC0BXU0_CATRO|nr:hypothetical protein M9H77_08415 [Catharanthus roseus]
MDLPQEERSLKKVLNCGSNLSFRRVSSHHWVLANGCEVQAHSALESEVPDENERKFDDDEELEQLLRKQICFKVYPFSIAMIDTACNVLNDAETNVFPNDKYLSTPIGTKLVVGKLSALFNTERKILLSGSYNSIHDGHIKPLEVATRVFPSKLVTVQYCKTWSLVIDMKNAAYLMSFSIIWKLRYTRVIPISLSYCAAFSVMDNSCFELSAIYADKPALTVSQIKDRVKQFENVGKTVIISNQPYFYRKPELFPGSAFVIGADIAVRLVNPKYYGGDYAKMLEILLGCKNTGVSCWWVVEMWMEFSRFDSK